MTELLRHPECMKKLRDEILSVSKHNLYVSEKEVEKMNYLNMVIKEVLRLHPSGPLIPRLVSDDVKVNGYDIAAGTRVKSLHITKQNFKRQSWFLSFFSKNIYFAKHVQVLINLYAIQRDTATWGPDAEKFRPERHFDSPLDFEGQNFKYFPFGSGRRRCPGDGLALPLVELTLANLVKRFNLRFEGGPKGDNKPDLLEATGLDVCRKFPLIVSPFSATISL